MSNTNQLLKGARDILVAAARPLSVRKIWDIGRKEGTFADGLDALDALRNALTGDADGRFVRSLRAGVFEAAPEPEPEPTPARKSGRRPRPAAEAPVEAAPPPPPAPEPPPAPAPVVARPERAERPERGDRPERAERPERGDRPERAERPERGERRDRGDRSERRERTERPAPRVETPAPVAAPTPPPPPPSAPADDDDDERGGRRRRRKTTDLLGEAPLAPLSIDEAVEAVEASRDPKEARRRLWDKIKARASALVGPQGDAPREPAPVRPASTPAKPAPAPAPVVEKPAPAPVVEKPAPAPVVEKPAPAATTPPTYAGDPRARLKARLAERAGQRPELPPELPKVEALQDSPYVEQRAPAPVPAPAPVVERRAPTLPEVQPTDDLAAAAETYLGGSSESPTLGALAAALPGRPDAAGLRAALLAENARRAHAGLRAPFVFRFDGRVGLSSAALSARYLELERRILTSMAEQREIIRRELLGRVGQLSDVAFEQVVLDLLTRLGFGEIRTVHRNRGTLLVFGRHEALGGAATAMVIRRSANEIAQETLGALRSALDDLDATHGLILTAGTFSAEARTSALATDEAPLTLIDGAGFARLMYEHGLGVVAHAPVLRYVDAAFFDSLG